jgi:hypothetical protein
MRSFSTILATASLLALASALPEPMFGQKKALQARDGQCMSASEAQQVATNFKDLIASYSNATADATLTTGFHDYSDSVIELINSGCTGPDAVCLV